MQPCCVCVRYSTRRHQSESSEIGGRRFAQCVVGWRFVASVCAVVSLAETQNNTKRKEFICVPLCLTGSRFARLQSEWFVVAWREFGNAMYFCVQSRAGLEN